MTTIIEIGLLALGFVLGILWFSVIILPIAYGFPRAFWWSLRGRARWAAPFAYLVSPVVWSIIFLGAAIVLVIFFRQTANFLMESGGFNVGQVAGIGLAAIRCVFSKSTHHDMNADFLSFMRPYLIEDMAWMMSINGSCQRFGEICGELGRLGTILEGHGSAERPELDEVTKTIDLVKTAAQLIAEATQLEEKINGDIEKLSARFTKIGNLTGLRRLSDIKSIIGESSSLLHELQEDFGPGGRMDIALTAGVLGAASLRDKP